MLPKEKRKATKIEPQSLIIVSPPKIGKTSLSAALPKHLLLDFENGSDYVDANAIKIKHIQGKRSEENKDTREFYLEEVLKELKEAAKNPEEFPYDFLIFDTATSMEMMIEEYATYQYMKTAEGKMFNRSLKTGKVLPKEQWQSVTVLSYGAGYAKIWEAFKEWVQPFKELPCNIILNGHIKYATINDKNEVVNPASIDLTGKLRKIASAVFCDAIGFMYRKGKDNIITFKASQSEENGVRCPYLSGKEFVISTQKEDGNVEIDWSDIYVETIK